ncbi:two-component sensor histidine kinase [Thiorhodococcus mannitoliphagus]|uniref:histidine kinase n=1 Tax=Thiorhodococcus mannitoliphagus TaxID=329406 RepID=A0A6P1E1W8_9GAMM|nr:ATP-binding protein [Thiorhodococcus mannitoliphagus]NEX21994.1 two-component sensor histidine kinase [Thiorhodococcus mannitoliphagus]
MDNKRPAGNQVALAISEDGDSSRPTRRIRPRLRRIPIDTTRYPTRGALRWLFLFRLLMVVGLVLAFSPTVMEPSAGRYETELAWDILVAYAVLVLVSGLGLSLEKPRRSTQVQLAIFIDIATFTALMHAAGGISSGLGVLLAVSVAAGALMMEGRLSLFFAAVASMAIMSQQIYSSLLGVDIRTSFTQAGFLGLLYFAVALLSHVLYQRIRSAEALAARRKVDIDDLAKLSDFVIHSISTGILVADGERRLRLVNEAALDLMAEERVDPGVSLNELSPELGSWLADQVQSLHPKDGLIRIGERDIWASIRLLGDCRASGVIIYLRDNQEAIREAQQIKLASLGTLTASIAHNIRNPLSSISHAAQLLAESNHLDADDRHLLDIIRRNSGRIEETVESVLQLSRRNQIDPQEINLKDWIQSFARELRESHALAETALLLDLNSAPPWVKVDTRHLHQILSNLCENALAHGGTDGQDASVHIHLTRRDERGEAWLEVRDNGPGIDPGIAKEIFSPFFTTKSQGTGLGLYIARELAESNGLRLVYERIEPRGSCFRLTLPID